MTTLIVLALVAIVAALASAGVFMLRRDGQPADSATEGQARRSRMARALAWRVGLSVTLFLLILLAWSLGWIAPTGLPVEH